MCAPSIILNAQNASFDMNTRPETFVPLIHCIINDTLSQAMPDLGLSDAASVHQCHKLDECRKCSMHTSVPEEDILALNVT